MKMEANNHQWIVIENMPASSKKSSGIILLSKIEKYDSKTVKIEFLVLDVGKNPRLILNPKIIVVYGKEAQMVIKDKNETLHFNILARA